MLIVHVLVPERVQAAVGVKFMVPVGAVMLPALLSVTVAEQVNATPIVPVGGHVTEVVVERRITVTEVVPVLELWMGSEGT